MCYLCYGLSCTTHATTKLHLSVDIISCLLKYLWLALTTVGSGQEARVVSLSK